MANIFPIQGDILLTFKTKIEENIETRNISKYLFDQYVSYKGSSNLIEIKKPDRVKKQNNPKTLKKNERQRDIRLKTRMKCFFTKSHNYLVKRDFENFLKANDFKYNLEANTSFKMIKGWRRNQTEHIEFNPNSLKNFIDQKFFTQL